MRSTVSNPVLHSQFQKHHHHRTTHLDDNTQQQRPSSSSPSTRSLTRQQLGDQPIKGPPKPPSGTRAVSTRTSTKISSGNNKTSRFGTTPPSTRRAVSSGSTPLIRNSVLSSTLISKTQARTPRITATASHFASRTPLARLDQNESLEILKSKVAAMPPNDKNYQQPRMPILSASTTQKTPGVARSAAPLTPKVSGITTPSSSKFVTAGNVTPVTTPLGKRSHRPNSIHARSSSKDDGISTPVSSFLNSNITPRSGSRQSRVDSAHSTPSGTPTADKSDAYAAENRTGLGISPGGEHPNGNPTTMPRRAVVSFSPVPSGASTPNRHQTNKRESKFFYALDANAKGKSTKIQQQQQQQQQQQLQSSPVRPSIAQQKQPSAFFHANGASIDKPAERTSGERSRPNSTHGALSGTVSPAITSPTAQQTSSKFFYANGTPDVDGLERKIASQNGSSAPPAGPPALARSGTTTPSSGMNHRPMSPTKLAQSSHFSVQKNSSLPSLTARCQPLGGAVAAGPAAAGAAGSSNASVGMNRICPAADTLSRPTPLGHARTGSVPTVEQIISMSKLMSSQLSSECSTPVSNASGPPAPTSAAEYFSEPDDIGSDGVQSPTQSHQGKDQLNELVANARRERKVQDLEITNASLEAINRTLERQLRKQQSELRRFRRLSRAGKFSPVASDASKRVVSDTLTAPSTIEGMDLSDLDEMEESEEEIKEELEEEEEGEDMDTSGLSGTESLESLPPEEQAIRDAKHREKDERRLQLDLTKHQELLVGSQKINQSLKRCLNWSDMMIKDGKRALAYNVEVGDIELGGRILPPPDEEGDEVSVAGTGDFDSNFVVEFSSTGQASPQQLSVEPHMWAKAPQDRDSGIEMPTELG
ncbi:hypothetical protein MKZ38_000033 [Zalerion maritima]|uniref:Uncharacterized protein n=1 Tax=Zalerion maritima TaxID=339359 RepID=A0AAD5WUW3_9PEZI|nr:hypothetical protein MKZ38_000033 [Zalerion maritima]